MKLSSVLTVTGLFLFSNIAKPQDNNYVPGEIIIMADRNADWKTLERDFRAINLRLKEIVVPDLNILLYEYEYASMQPLTVLEKVRKHRAVVIAQFNHYVQQRSAAGEIGLQLVPVFPNDTRFSEQWSLHNTGQNGGQPDADIDAPEAWNITTGGVTAQGDSIIVAVVDGGFYLTHQDLRFWRNWEEIPGNNIDDDNNGYIDDVNGWNAYNNNGNITGNTHGSHVSGIAGAIGNNNNGIAGVNWGIKIMAVMGSSGTEAVVLRAYGYVLKQRKIYNQTNGAHGAFVVSSNSSFGVDYGQPSQYPLWCAFYDSLGAAGILNACATANLNINVDIVGDIPTACPSPFMVSVTNTTNQDLKNPGAAYGPTTIDLGAPGTTILSTTTSPNNYGNLTGTSMATPHVAGAFALMFAAASSSLIQAYKNDPDSIALVFKEKMLQGVDSIPALQGITVSGGRLNVYKAILLIQSLTAAENNSGDVPASYVLHQNYPNPFNPATVIRYEVRQKGFVTLRVYNSLGQEVSVLVSKDLRPGRYDAVWDGTSFPSGVYYYKLVAGDYMDTKKMVLIK
jgi:subtilisin family serine protease